MPERAKITVERDALSGRVDDRLYGSFVEHLGRCVYTGLYEPGHPLADGDGFRTDVLEAVKALRLPVCRYPGGNFVSGYRWEDGVGPVAERPVRTELAWQAIESNEFGLGEFLKWCGKAGCACMMAVNLGTRGIAEAHDLLEYCNFPGGTYLSDLRKKHGAAAPYDIKLWCLGNEMDGEWQIGHKTAYEYGRLASETAKVMKTLDDTIEVVACGSSNLDMPTFGSWERQVLSECYGDVDYLSLHQYFNDNGMEGDRQSFLAQAVKMDDFIRRVIAVCDAVRAEKRTKKTMYLSFDEWNLWYHSNAQDREVPKWIQPRPLLEDVYTFEDAVVLATLLNTLIRHSDRVKIACLAQLVNVIAPIMTVPGGGMWLQPIYYPFLYASRYGRGRYVPARVDCPRYESRLFGDVSMLDVAAVAGDDGGLYVSVVNTSVSEEAEVTLSPNGFGKWRIAEHAAMETCDRLATNGVDTPTAVCPHPAKGRADDGGYVFSAPPASVHMLRFTTK